ncbi:DUF4236 domain-containing protein [Caballeronia cordobensis]|uniref:DUF4236 domain-containing protein n=1 Tax=Caballeronia cordobensis TaxID=1353886 RepID=UPI00045EE4E4|nr:uncharacterized protein BRPE67_BCDS10920 [Burkholderia sp. RPE67]
MGWSWRKSIKVAPGVRVNPSKNGMSTSLGGNGVTYNTKSGRTTYSVPGTGWRYTTTGRRSRSSSTTEHEAPRVGWVIALGILVAILMFLVMVLGALLTSGGNRRRVR